MYICELKECKSKRGSTSTNLTSQYYFMKEILKATDNERNIFVPYFEEWDNSESSKKVDTLSCMDGIGAKQKLN